MIEIQLLHHKSLKWTDYLLLYTQLKDLVHSGLVSTSVGKLPDSDTSTFADLPEAVRRLMFFGKPDVVVCLDDGVNPVRPFFALDVTEHAAARDHWMQRFPNLVGCAQEGVPGVFVSPGDTPNRNNFAGSAQPDFFFAFDRVIEIHQTPLYIAEWPSTDGSTLDRDSHFTDLPPHDAESIARALTFFNLVLDSAMRGREFAALMQERLVVELRNELRKVGYRQVPAIADYGRLTANMPDNRFLTHVEMIAWLSGIGLRMPSKLPDRIGKRDQYLIYTPRVKNETTAARRLAMLKRIKEKGGDPYGAQPLAFDYLFCRLGPSPLQRDVNVVVDLSFFSLADFASWVKKTWANSPLKEDTFPALRSKMAVYSMHLSEPLVQVMKNYIRWQIFSADLIVFSDGVLVL